MARPRYGIELDTGRRVDFIPESARGGDGFCCAAYYPSPDRRLILIEGCYWACPYELVFCRFDDPMNLPWSQVERVESSGQAVGWSDEGFVYETLQCVRITDGKAFEDLSDEEQDDFWKRRAAIGGYRKRRYVRLYDGQIRLLSERVDPTGPTPRSGKPS